MISEIQGRIKSPSLPQMSSPSDVTVTTVGRNRIQPTSATTYSGTRESMQTVKTAVDSFLLLLPRLKPSSSRVDQVHVRSDTDAA